MKKLLSTGIMLLILSASYLAFGQNQLLNELTITPPSFHNADYDNLNAYLTASLEYPERALKDELQGTEVIRFKVTPSGRIEDLTVINSVTGEIDEEVIRIIQKTDGKWDPGTIDGEPATMVREVSVTFALHSFEIMLKTAEKYMQRGNKMMFTKKKPEKALQYYDKAATLFPYEENILLIKGYCLDQLGRTAEAEENQKRLKILAENNRSFALHNGHNLFIDNFSAELIVQPE